MITKKQWKQFIANYTLNNPLKEISYLQIHLKDKGNYISTAMNDRILSITEVTSELLAIEVLKPSFRTGFNHYQIIVLPLKRKNVEAIFYSYRVFRRSVSRKIYRRNKIKK